MRRHDFISPVGDALAAWPLGARAQRDQVMPKRQIWFRSARAWATHLDDIPKHQKQR